MPIVIGLHGRSLFLNKTYCRDKYWEVTRAEVRRVLVALAKTKGRHNVRILILDRASRYGVYVSTDKFKSGAVRLGCHTFNPKDARILRKWAKAQPR